MIVMCNCLQVMFGVPFGHEIDVWSLGCILAEVLIAFTLLHYCSVLIPFFCSSAIKRWIHVSGLVTVKELLNIWLFISSLLFSCTLASLCFLDKLNMKYCRRLVACVNGAQEFQSHSVRNDKYEHNQRKLKVTGEKQWCIFQELKLYHNSYTWFCGVVNRDFVLIWSFYFYTQ